MKSEVQLLAGAVFAYFERARPGAFFLSTDFEYASLRYVVKSVNGAQSLTTLLQYVGRDPNSLGRIWSTDLGQIVLSSKETFEFKVEKLRSETLRALIATNRLDPVEVLILAGHPEEPPP